MTKGKRGKKKMAEPRRRGKKVPFLQRFTNQAKALMVMGGVLSVSFGGWFFMEGRFEAKGAHEAPVATVTGKVEAVQVKHKEDVVEIQKQLTGYNLRFELKLTADAIRFARDEMADLRKRFGTECGKLAGRCEELQEDMIRLKENQRQLNQELLRRRK